jgi:hypothetical protein
MVPLLLIQFSRLRPIDSTRADLRALGAGRECRSNGGPLVSQETQSIRLFIDKSWSS